MARYLVNLVGKYVRPERPGLMNGYLRQKNNRRLFLSIIPRFKCGVLETDVDGFVGVDRFGDIVEKYSNIKSILCGHIHLPAHIGWRGTFISTAPSMGIPLVLDLTMKQPSQFTLDVPGFQLHYWSPEKNLVTHTIFVRDTAGPYLFEDL
ncbi:MAG: hypothetical protein DRH07_11505 [Deltaproteobacteria bacterium]|nr:MAG: hypothetical protein DRH07_11505 [Deltaproteobacteria bacterium]